MNKRALELASRVPGTNINQIEQGRRGLPEIDTLTSLSNALGLTLDERRELIETAIADVLGGRLRQLAIYYFLFLASDDDMRDLFDSAQKLTKGNRKLRELFGDRSTKPDARIMREIHAELLRAPELRRLRDELAMATIQRVIVDLTNRRVELHRGPTGHKVAFGIEGGPVESSPSLYLPDEEGGLVSRAPGRKLAAPKPDA